MVSGDVVEASTSKEKTAMGEGEQMPNHRRRRPPDKIQNLSSVALKSRLDYKFLLFIVTMDQKLPLFFRVMNVQGSETKLQLPPMISRKLVEQDIKEVLLTSQKGIWEVEIHSFEGKLWFTKGWDDFVLRHGLSNIHLLLFKHTGNSSFKVKVLDWVCGYEIDFNGDSKTKNKRGKTQGKNAEDIDRVSVKHEVDIDEVPSPVEIQKHDHAHDKEDNKRKRKSEVVNVSSTRHPQFVTSIKQYNVRRRSPYMHIPADFCVANDLYNNGRICLKGPSSEQEVSLKVCKGR
nr:B3 domain-containing protein REM9-like [Ipomoea batatas]